MSLIEFERNVIEEPSSSRIDAERSISRVFGASRRDDRTNPEASREGLSGLASLYWILAIAVVGAGLDLAATIAKRSFDPNRFFHLMSRHFHWQLPSAAFVVLTIPGLLYLIGAAIVGKRPLERVLIGLCVAWAFLEASLRLPIATWSSVIVAIGAGACAARLASRIGAERRARRAGLVAAAGIVCWIGVVVESIYHDIYRSRNSIPVVRSGTARMRNVVLIVLDAVRAESLSLNGYDRDTTPNLKRWAKRGVSFDRAVAPSSWTFPSHASMFTGYWPYQFNVDWRGALKGDFQTTAGYLASAGYRTIGIVGNTSYCSWETGLDRGFERYEDHLETFRTIAAQSSLAAAVLDRIPPADVYEAKWRSVKSRDAAAINRLFFNFLAERSAHDETAPYFAFLNYIDAHEPFVTPKNFPGKFAGKPRSPAEEQLLLEYSHLDKSKLTTAQVAFLRNAYDDSIAHLDREIGALLDELDRRGALESTVVVITSDHGESLGEHDFFNHGKSLYWNEIHVPLLIIAPGSAPAGKKVSVPVSTRDLAATLAEMSGSPKPRHFHGSSLSRYWIERPAIGRTARGTRSTAMSVVYGLEEPDPAFGTRVDFEGMLFSLVVDDYHFIRNQSEKEALFNVAADRSEDHNLINDSGSFEILNRLRARLCNEIDDNGILAGIEPEPLEIFRFFLHDRIPRGRRTAAPNRAPARSK
jgi:arylsulfatase A-like enzyme